jgi:hypothetical protein
MANFRQKPNTGLIAVLPSSDSTLGAITSAHIGRVCVKGTDGVQLLSGVNDDSTSYVGIIASVPNTVTAGGSIPFYVRPFTSEDIIEEIYTGTAPTDASIGSYAAYAATPISAGNPRLDTSKTSTTVGGARSGRFLKITGYDTNRKVLFGVPDSSRISR